MTENKNDLPRITRDKLDRRNDARNADRFAIIEFIEEHEVKPLPVRIKKMNEEEKPKKPN